MARVEPRDTVVLLRGETTTTYHFGLGEPICGDARGNTPAVATQLKEALAIPRRLCRNCADLISDWTATIASVASATDLVHPDK